MTEDAIETDIRAYRGQDERQGHKVLHTIDSEKGRESLIDEPHGPDEKGKQGVTEDIIDHFPVGDAEIDQGVVTREMELALKDFPVGAKAFLLEKWGHAVDEKDIEQNNQQRKDLECNTITRLYQMSFIRKCEELPIASAVAVGCEMIVFARGKDCFKACHFLRSIAIGCKETSRQVAIDHFYLSSQDIDLEALLCEKGMNPIVDRSTDNIDVCTFSQGVTKGLEGIGA